MLSAQGERVDTTVAMVGGEKKFGFSIAGGANRSHFPKVDNIHPGESLHAAQTVTSLNYTPAILTYPAIHGIS